jgi:hypothetical protein
MNLNFCANRSRLERCEGNGDYLLLSSGVRKIRIPLSYLDVLYTDLPESPRQFSGLPLEDRFFAATHIRGSSESSARGAFSLSFAFFPLLTVPGNRGFGLLLAGGVFLRYGSHQ